MMRKNGKVSGICLILIGIATGVDAFTESMAAKIAYVVILFVILAVFLFLLRTKCLKNNIGPISVIHKNLSVDIRKRFLSFPDSQRGFYFE